jgi:hypothetical protein
MADQTSNLKTECMSIQQLRNLQKVADLCNALTIHPALLKAHQKPDTVVDAAYQPSGGKKTYANDAERVAFLFGLYKRISSFFPGVRVKKTRKAESQKVDCHDQSVNSVSPLNLRAYEV